MLDFGPSSQIFALAAWSSRHLLGPFGREHKGVEGGVGSELGWARFQPNCGSAVARPLDRRTTVRGWWGASGSSTFNRVPSEVTLRTLVHRSTAHKSAVVQGSIRLFVSSF